MQENFSLVSENISKQKEQAKDKSSSISFPCSAVIKKLLQHSQEIKDQTIIISLDAIIINDERLLANFAENISILSLCGANIVIIHDYAELPENNLKAIGINADLLNNTKLLKYSNIQLVEMLLSGYINKYIVSKLCDAGCSAIGISGKDANLIQAKKTYSSHKRQLCDEVINIGFIYEPVVTNPEILLNFEHMNIISVISPIAFDESKRAQVLDADLMASAIASAVAADHLIFYCKIQLASEDNIRIDDIKKLKKIRKSEDYNINKLLEIAHDNIEQNSNEVHFLNIYEPNAILYNFFPMVS